MVPEVGGIQVLLYPELVQGFGVWSWGWFPEYPEGFVLRQDEFGEVWPLQVVHIRDSLVFNTI